MNVIIIFPGYYPEALSIAHLTWNHGLQIGNHDLEIINRMRKKKALETVLPPMDTPANIKKRTAMLNALEIDEWTYRESVNIFSLLKYRLYLFLRIKCLINKFLILGNSSNNRL